MFIESIEWWCRTHTPISLYGRQPGLTHRSTCPSIPGLGQGAPHPKRCLHGLDLSAYPQNHSTHGTHRTHRTISPIQEESYLYDGMLDSPYTPSPSCHSWRSIWGKKSIYFGLFVGEVPFPSNISMHFILCSLGLGLLSSLNPFVV